MNNVAQITTYALDNGVKTVTHCDAIDGVPIKNGSVARITWPNGSITYNDVNTITSINDVDMCTRNVSTNAYVQIDYEGYIFNVSLTDHQLVDVRIADVKCTKLS